MTESPDEQPRSLSENWRERIAEIGKINFENEEMLRLGFITPAELEGQASAEANLEAYRRVLAELVEVRRALSALDADLAAIRDVENLIAEIRRRRIERVQAARAQRRAQKHADREARAARNRERRVIEPTYLGRRVSNHLQFEGGNADEVAARRLPALSTFVDVAEALELTPSQLQWLVYERGADATDHYTRFEIPKRSGGRRLISSPKPALRAAQMWVRTNVLTPLPVGPSAAAFRPGRSIVDNAERHQRKACVVRLDLKNFFPSITFSRVRGFFESLGYNPGVATVLALICTDAPRARLTLDGTTQHVVIGERSLPQGACTSPDLANLIAAGLDARVAGLARKMGYDYSRYADDLVLSTSRESVTAAIMVRILTSICADEGFHVNERKTRIMRTPHRQIVTGLLVNDEIRLTRSDLRRIRAFLHNCETRGVETISREIGKDAQAVASGYFAYVYMVSRSTALKLREKHSWI